jgi:autotransporter-associated beta strand protein
MPLATGTGATAGGLTKIGSGTLSLSGSNTYTGPTAISAGALAVNGSIAGAVNVANAATLGGNGTINGLVTVAGGGILAPGNSPGTLTMTSGLSLADSSILNYELLATDTTVGGGINDLTVVSGNFTLNGILNVTGTGDFTTVADYTTWRLFNYSGGTFTDNVLSLGTMPSLGSGDRYFKIDTSTSGQVNLVIVPEPGAIALAAVGLVIAGWHASRKRLATRS